MRLRVGLIIVLASALVVTTGHAAFTPRPVVLVSLPATAALNGALMSAAPASAPRRAQASPAAPPSVRQGPTHPIQTTADPVPTPASAALSSVDPQSYLLARPPSISVGVITGVLARYGSPLAGQAQRIYDLGVAYGIDPAYCLAFFVHESAAGTRGEAVLTRSMGNIRARAGQPSHDGYRLYTSWDEGLQDWYRLIRDLYVGRWKLGTVAAVVPVYAPSTDSNDVAAYISDVQSLVSYWHALSAAHRLPPTSVVHPPLARASAPNSAQS